MRRLLLARAACLGAAGALLSDSLLTQLIVTALLITAAAAGDRAGGLDG